MKNIVALVSMLFCSCGGVLMAQNSVPITHSPTLVVAQRSFINQAGDIPPTSLFKPACKGIYRVNMDIEQSNTAGGYGPEAFLSWTGDFASYETQVFLPLVYSGDTAAASGELTIRGAAGQPIQVSTTVNPNEQGTYNLYVVVEKLSELPGPGCNSVP